MRTAAPRQRKELGYPRRREHSRHDKLLHVVDRLLSDHDDEELLCELDQATAAAARFVADAEQVLVVAGVTDEAAKGKKARVLLRSATVSSRHAPKRGASLSAAE